jgi:hypothetical protein
VWHYQNALLALATLLFTHFGDATVRVEHPVCTGKFLSDFSEFGTFNAQEHDDMTLFQVHQIGTF